MPRKKKTEESKTLEGKTFTLKIKGEDCTFGEVKLNGGTEEKIKSLAKQQIKGEDFKKLNLSKQIMVLNLYEDWYTKNVYIQQE